MNCKMAAICHSGDNPTVEVYDEFTVNQKWLLVDDERP
jgi:hypothetical protein